MKRSLLVCLIMILCVFAGVYGFKHESFIQELQTSLGTLSILFFVFFFCSLYFGWKIKRDHKVHNLSLQQYIKKTRGGFCSKRDNRPDLSRSGSGQEKGGTDLPDADLASPGGDILSGASEAGGCEEFAVIILGIFAFLGALYFFWYFLGIAWLLVILAYSILYWLSYQGMKGILQHSKHHQGMIGESFLYAILYTFITTGRIFCAVTIYISYFGRL